MSAATWIQSSERHLEMVATAARRATAFAPAVAAVAGALVGLATGIAMARGPATSEQGLAVIASGLVLGLALGLVLPSRWGIAIAFLAYGVAFEIVRRGTVGPTVDAIRLDNTFGIIASSSAAASTRCSLVSRS